MTKETQDYLNAAQNGNEDLRDAVRVFVRALAPVEARQTELRTLAYDATFAETDIGVQQHLTGAQRCVNGVRDELAKVQAMLQRLLNLEAAVASHAESMRINVAKLEQQRAAAQ